MNVRRPTSSFALPRGESGKIEIRESRVNGVFLAGPADLRVRVAKESDVRDLVRFGDRARAYASTNCNEHSSRSHAILTLHVQSQTSSIQAPVLPPFEEGSPHKSQEQQQQQQQQQEQQGVRLGKLNLVDLAGSERVSLSGARGETLVEAQNINLSLALLGDVLAALSRNAQATQRSAARAVLEAVPYRNSKLTHLLKDSLGGNSKTLMVTNLCACATYFRQSLVSLMYASRARMIRNRTLVNVDTSSSQSGSGKQGQESLRQVSSELNELQLLLRSREREYEQLCARSKGSVDENALLKKKLAVLDAQHRGTSEQLEHKLGTVIHSQRGQLATQQDQFSQLQKRLHERLDCYQQTCEKQQQEVLRLKRDRAQLQQSADEAMSKRDFDQLSQTLSAWQQQV